MKQIVYPLLTFIVMLGLITPAWAASYPFKDVDAKSPYKEIYVLSKNDILSGVTYERFGGELDFKRFDLADSLMTLLGNRQVPSNVYTIIADVQPGSDKYKTVSKMIQGNLIELKDNKFQGLRYVTRYELMQSLQRLLNFMGASPPLPRDKELKFRDVDPEYKDDVHQVTNVWQITEGYPDGLFRGDNRVTRNEAAIMLAKVASTLYEDFKIQLAGNIPTPPGAKTAATPNPTAVNSGNPVITPSTSAPDPSRKPTLEELLNASSKPSPNVQTSQKPVVKPTIKPTTKPSVNPTPKVTKKPVVKPSTKPTKKPVVKPSAKATKKPITKSSGLSELEKMLQPKASNKPSTKPVVKPSPSPSKLKIDVTGVDIGSIFGKPKKSPLPTTKPSTKPTVKPTVKPTPKPTKKPVVKPTKKPTVKPTVKPTPKATKKPVSTPPTIIPSAKPIPRPTSSTQKSLSALEKKLLALRSSSSATPKPKISVKPALPETLTKTPLPTPTPKVAKLPTTKPTSKPELPKVRLNKMRPALDNRVLFYGNYRALYEERVPPGILQALNMDPNSQSISGDAGLSANLNTLFWFGEPGTLLGNLGLGLDIASLGGIKFNDADLTDIIWTDLSVLYKVVNTPHFDLATGLSGYFRMTDSSNDPRTNYFQASRTYIGIGARITSAYRIIEPLSLELTISPHYVIQDLANIALPQLPLNRFDTQIQFLLNWDIVDIGGAKLSLDTGYQGSLLFDLGSEASQMIHGGILGIGYHF